MPASMSASRGRSSCRPVWGSEGTVRRQPETPILPAGTAFRLSTEAPSPFRERAGERERSLIRGTVFLRTPCFPLPNPPPQAGEGTVRCEREVLSQPERSAPRSRSVGWVEFAKPMLSWRWVSLRSTHPTPGFRLARLLVGARPARDFAGRARSYALNRRIASSTVSRSPRKGCLPRYSTNRGSSSSARKRSPSSVRRSPSLGVPTSLPW